MLRKIRRRFAEDPFLKVGIVAMTLALAFAGVVAFMVYLEGPHQAVAVKSSTESTSGTLVRSDSDTNPGSRDISSSASPEPGSRSGESADQSPNALPLNEEGFPLPTEEQLEAAHRPRHYHLPPGAIMSLTIRTIGLRNVPVLDSDTPGALEEGVAHLSDTSLPWSDTPERNVYLAGHRLGWPGTGSHLVFYRLDELTGGERITLRARDGTKYDYRVLESFTVWPDENWVTGRVRGRDLLTLQTCAPIPTFEKRLIVRAELI